MSPADHEESSAVHVEPTHRPAPRSRRARTVAGGARIVWTVATLVVVQSIVCGLAVLPVVAVAEPLIASTAGNPIAKVVAVSFAVVPSYALFAIALMFGSAASTRVTGWRTQPNAHMRLADLDWPLLNWVRYMVGIHIVRLFAGTLFRGTPIWSAYLRLNGARVGRRVYVNSLAVSDHNLLEFGDDVVIGGDVHLSGHTVESGFVKTAPVRLRNHVTVGVGSVIGIGVTIGSDVQIGALSLVPKHVTLDGGSVYVGVPARPLASEVSPSDGQRTSIARAGERVAGVTAPDPGRGPDAG